MKIIISILIGCTGFYSFGQQWQHIDASDYTVQGSFSISPYINKNFKINPYDNSIWMSNSWTYKSVRQFDPQGNFLEYSYLNEGTFTNQSVFSDFEFAGNKTFVISDNTGLHSFDGASWSVATTYINGLHISSDADSLWVTRSADNYYTWKAGGISAGNYGFNRMVSKNGKIWISTGAFDIIGTYVPGGSPVYHSPDTSALLSWNNYDFKFAKLTDTLYSSSDLGISMAHDGFFFDSITPNNSTNMPAAGIIEFEFDSQDNIWAVFCADNLISTSPTHIGYYDQLSNTWTQVYDTSNSPLGFDAWMTIEVDTSDNLWVIHNGDLYVLKINNWPSWLDVYEHNISSFEIYPNPASEVLNIKVDESIFASEVEIRDTKGQLIKRCPYADKINIDVLSSGVYFIQLLDNGEFLGIQRFVVQ